MTITDFCCELNNYFKKEIYLGEFTIEGGRIVLPAIVDIKNGQYFRIVGSVFNDGVYQHPATGLTNEVFQGAVWTMAIPTDALELFNQIKDWDTKYGQADIVNGPYQSESFGSSGYSYTLKSSDSNSGADATTWQGHFKAQLRKFKKVKM